MSAKVKATGSVQGQTPPPSSNAPVLSVGTVTSTAVTLNWTVTPSRPTGWGWYRVHWGTSSGNYTGSNDSQVTPSLTYTVTGLKTGTKYYFMVTLYQSGASGNWNSNEVSATPGGGSTPPPTTTYSYHTWNAKLNTEQATNPSPSALMTWINANPPKSD